MSGSCKTSAATAWPLSLVKPDLLGTGAGGFCLKRARTVFFLQFYLPQSERIPNYRNRTEGHGRAGDCGTQQQAEERVQNSCRDRHAERVVHERKKQILADASHGGAALNP